MEIKLPIKLHNKFEIKVKDIITGEVIQKGFAENIVLDNLLVSSYFCSNSATDFFGASIQ